MNEEMKRKHSAVANQTNPAKGGHQAQLASARKRFPAVRSSSSF
jgi:hypothetical protein